MRGPVGFGYAIASNWCTKELQGVWQPEMQTSVVYGPEITLEGGQNSQVS